MMNTKYLSNVLNENLAEYQASLRDGDEAAIELPAQEKKICKPEFFDVAEDIIAIHGKQGLTNIRILVHVSQLNLRFVSVPKTS